MMINNFNRAKKLNIMINKAYMKTKQDYLQDQKPQQQQHSEQQYNQQMPQHDETQQIQQEQKNQQQHYEQQQKSNLQQQQAQQQQLQLQQQNLQQKQQQSAQQLQATVMTGAATLGSLMAGGAKKLGSFFGAAAAAVSAPAAPQSLHTNQSSTVPTNQFSTGVVPVTPFSSKLPVTASVPETTPSAPTSTATTTAPTLPRTPSLRRQESIQRPPVRRTRTLPDAPDDLLHSSFDESAYEDEYHKTEYDQSIDRDKISLDRYRDDEYMHDTIHEEDVDDRHMSEIPSSPRSPLHKVASPTRAISQMRKPSVDSYHSQTPSVIDRRTSQSSFQHEDKLSVPGKQEEQPTEKSKVTFQDERTTYHEVAEDTSSFRGRQESFDDQGDDYQDEDAYHEDEFQDEHEKFDDQDQFRRDGQYNEEDGVFQEPERRDEKAEQPKFTARQRWHRAYNKIVMQLNVSHFSILTMNSEYHLFLVFPQF
ncbi:putative uncharacterized protein DDB_G0291608 [Bombyx mandarina]|uniref:Uncharacterized protein n=1 Tax=Bombyx mandarina TaxID=7092 RepID=A0A6J2KAB1_BOMMA|nr:putative uncharacterized protein DDB_G0291608 [Bombyx mandarina]